MRLDRRLLDDEFGGDLAVGQAARDQPEYLAFSAGQRADPLCAGQRDGWPRNVFYDRSSNGRVEQRIARGDRVDGGDQLFWMDMDRIDEVVTVGMLEAWEVLNQDEVPHSFHVHDVQFQIARIGDDPPPPHLAGWKDTVYLPPGVPISLVMRFADYTDPMTPYMYHCHLMFHEDMGMMGQFVVVRPGEQAMAPDDAGMQHDHMSGA